MKKVFIFFMALFLLINSVGYTVYAHYCNEELMNTSVIVNNTKACCEEEEEPMNCCAEQNIHIVIKDQFLKSELNFPIAVSQPVFIHNPNTLFYIEAIPSDKGIDFKASAEPPDKSPPNFQILYSVFRI